MRDFVSYPFVAREFNATIPSLRDGHEIRRHAIVIVGGGPVGLAAALCLARHGVPSVIIESNSRVSAGSRAICISRRSLEILQRCAAVDDVIAKALPWTGGRSFYGQSEVLHFQMPHDSAQQYAPMVNLQQYYLEQSLLDAATRQSALIDLRWRSRCVGITQDGDHVALTIATPNLSYTMHADWVIACDGARSFVRDALGIKLRGTTYEGRYVIVDIALKSTRPTERLAWFNPPSNPASTLLMHKQPGDIWRIDYQLHSDEDAEAAIKPEQVIPRVDSHLKMIGESAEWSPIWVSLYKANALTLDRFRHQRVIFAGDAAHLLPIFGVRGLNSGLDDVDNLAWKLALVTRKLASELLLDTYSDERVAAAHENLRQASKSTEFMAPPSYGFELMRNAALSLAIDHAELRTLINPRQTAAINYHSSSLNQSDTDSFVVGPAPGEAIPECWLETINNGAFLTRLLGPGITVLYFAETDVMPLALIALAAQMMKVHDIEVTTVVIPVPIESHAVTLFDGRVDTLYLIRPDGYVLARWRALNRRAIHGATQKIRNGK